VLSVLPPQIISVNTVSGINGTPFTYQIIALNNPSGFGAIGLPEGLFLNTNTGFISGIPYTPGTTTTTINAFNALGNDVNTLIITISKDTNNVP